MILLTCSGMNLGVAIWARAEMEGLCATHDLIRIRVDPSSAPPGYVFAFLAGRYGHGWMRKQIYGGNIKHIEPHHAASVPVPRLGEELEQRVHELVLRAAELRTTAVRSLRETVQALEKKAGLPPLAASPSPAPFSCNTVPSSSLRGRFDALFHSAYHRDATTCLSAAALPVRPVGDLCSSVVEPGRFKRIKVDDPSLGVPFFGTSALMKTEPVELYHLPRQLPGLEEYLVDRRSLLVPRSGQLVGIIGTAIYPHGPIVGSAVTEDAIRVNCSDEVSAGFLFVAMSSEYSVRQLKARCYGSSIPHLDVHQIGSVLVPDPGPDERKRLGALGVGVSRSRSEALRIECEARRLVEQAIEDAS